MPGEISRSSEGPRSGVPLIPRWVPSLPDEGKSQCLQLAEDIAQQKYDSPLKCPSIIWNLACLLHDLGWRKP